jgi:DNA-binding MarR family transcriptional regulator
VSPPPTRVAALNELADRGLTQRSPDPNERRRSIITITRAENRRLRRLEKILADVQDELLARVCCAGRRARLDRA